MLFRIAKKSLSQLRQLYFKMKDKVFGSDRFGFAYNTEALEKLLKDEFGSSMKLSDVDFPKYYFFNIANCHFIILLFPQSGYNSSIQENHNA